LLKLRTFGSDLEGHPTPRLPFVDVATGSLGQGLGVGCGMALAARLDKLDYNTYGPARRRRNRRRAVWEAASLAGIYKLNNLIAIVDDNRLGQSQATAFGHDTSVYAKRFEHFGWRVEVIDGTTSRKLSKCCKASASTTNRSSSSPKTTKRGHFIFAGQGRLARQAVEQGREAKAIANFSPARKVESRSDFPRQVNCQNRKMSRDKLSRAKL